MLITLILRLALAYALSDVSECCFKSSSSSDASDSNTGATGGPQPPSSILQATTTVGSPGGNRLPCTAAEEQRMDCHNGGSCFAVLNANNARQPFCVCTPDWTGVYCEERNIKLGHVQSAGSTNTAAIVVPIAVILSIIAITVLIVVLVFRRKNQQKKLNKTAKDARSKETFESFSKKNIGVQENLARDEVPTVDKALTVPEDVTYDYDQSVDGSSEQLANRLESRDKAPDVVPEMAFRQSRGYNYNPITIQPFADRRSNGGDTSFQYPESIISSRSSTYSQVRQHETSI